MTAYGSGRMVMTGVESGFSHAPPTAEAARARFAVSDLARQTRDEQWTDPGAGERTYREADR